MIDRKNSTSSGCICRIMSSVISSKEASLPDALWEPLVNREFPKFTTTTKVTEMIPDNVPGEKHMFISSVQFERHPKQRTFKIGKELKTDEDVVEFVEMLAAMHRAFFTKSQAGRKLTKVKKVPTSSAGRKRKFPKSSVKQVEVKVKPINSINACDEIEDSDSTCDYEDATNGSPAPSTVTIDDSTSQNTDKSKEETNGCSDSVIQFPVTLVSKNPNWSDLSWSTQANRDLKEAKKLLAKQMGRKTPNSHLTISGSRFIYVQPDDHSYRENFVAILGHQISQTPCFITAAKGFVGYYKMRPSVAVAFNPLVVKEYIDKVETLSQVHKSARYLNCQCMKLAYNTALKILAGEDNDGVELKTLEEEDQAIMERIAEKRKRYYTKIKNLK